MDMEVTAWMSLYHAMNAQQELKCWASVRVEIGSSRQSRRFVRPRHHEWSESPWPMFEKFWSAPVP
jgi:hypothetical protein